MRRRTARTALTTRTGLTATSLATCTIVAGIAFGPAAAQAAVEPDPGAFSPVASSAPDAAIGLSPLGSFSTGVFDESAAEIVQFHGGSKRAFVVNAQAGVAQVLDLSDPTTPERLFDLVTAGVVAADGSTIPASAVANSVAVRADGLVALAVEADPKTDAGWLVFFDASGSGTALGAVRVGALPDMVTFSPDGATALVANEGEPAEDYSSDPEGTVSVVAVPETIDAPAQTDVRSADFHAYEAGGSKTLPEGVRVFGVRDGAVNPVSENLEPEYVTVSGGTAYVSLQEANAIAVLDIASATVTDIHPLGYQDFSVTGLDASDRDGAVDISTWPVRGLFQPDAIGSYVVDGESFVVSANEGDSRDWDGYSEEARVKDLDVCEPLAAFTADEQLGRLKVTTADGFDEAAGCYSSLYAFGGRSFSIWSSDGQQVFDSGSDFERITAAALPEGAFNSDHVEVAFDSRSDDKGPEPEGLALGRVGDRDYAFIGLERVGGVMVYDITDPAGATFVTYVNNRDFSVADPSASPEALAASGDLGPEGLAFVPASDSPTGAPLLLVGNEVSGTTTTFAVTSTAAPTPTPTPTPTTPSPAPAPGPQPGAPAPGANPAPGAAPAAPGAELAATGSDAAGFAALAVFLVGAGALAAHLTRRLRRRA
ncbi:choice-of-anchor I family protein [Herbiconiux sp. CPCC 205716]|uniref:Choice-of-anchor I family protein n=1 Tax=Herbiconiux gentiana TaxID=2970912 RepID=A0ABT2G9Y7_9MICO|nr:choice-of-anchor I family protein [Herbiconiux gentiana]MCS5713005.1 choice-of-anchor I family protein [Herbiconiux gentiana]